MLHHHWLAGCLGYNFDVSWASYLGGFHGVQASSWTRIAAAERLRLLQQQHFLAGYMRTLGAAWAFELDHVMWDWKQSRSCAGFSVVRMREQLNTLLFR